MQNFINQDLEELKKKVFKEYQNTLVPHNSNKQFILENTLHHLSIKQEDIEVIKRIYSNKNIPTSSQYTNLYNNIDIQTEGYKKY